MSESNESNDGVRTDLLDAYDAQLRMPVRPEPGVTHEFDGPVQRVTGRRTGFVSGPRDLGVSGAELDALIARQRDFYRDRGEAVEWKTRAHDTPADIEERLRAAGFVADPVETVLIGSTAEMAAREPVMPDGVLLREVSSEADIRAIAAMESEVWGEDWSWLADDLLGRVAADPGALRIIVAEAAGTVVSAAWLAVARDTEFGGLWGGSTLAAWRGRGIYRALVAHRARLARDMGLKYLHVDASDDSAPILRRLGFHAVTRTTPYVWTPPAS